MNIKINREYRDLTPPLTERDFISLKEDIRRYGQRYRVILNQNEVIVDGHNRHEACQQLGIKTITETRTFNSVREEIEFIISSNSKRRHLNEFQKAEMGYKLEVIYREAARQRQLSSLKLGTKVQVPLGSFDPNGENEKEKGRTADLVSAEVGIKATIYKRARKIILEGSEIAKQNLRIGKSSTSISKEYKKIQIEETRKRLINEKQKIDLPDGCELHLGDFMEIGNKIPDNSIGMIFTDPSYDKKSLPAYEKLGEFGQRVLMPGSALVTYAGQYALPTILELVTRNGLKFLWPFCVQHTGGEAKIGGFGTLIYVGWKPLLCFIKENNGRTRTKTEEYIHDFIPSEPPDKIIHPWEQSVKEAYHMIKGLTVENQIVVDPLMGSGTSGVAARKLNRKFIGIEKEPIYFSEAQRRLSDIEGSNGDGDNKKC